MDQDYRNALSDQLEIECSLYGQIIEINGNELKALVSTSPTTKNLQVAGFYSNKTLDAILPLYSEEPKLNHIVLFNSDTYQVKTIEELEYNTGHRLAIELIP